MFPFQNSRAEICQFFVGFLENLRLSKRHSEINWPLSPSFWQSAYWLSAWAVQSTSFHFPAGVTLTQSALIPFGSPSSQNSELVGASKSSLA